VQRQTFLKTLKVMPLIASLREIRNSRIQPASKIPHASETT